jgi:uncharacterized protein (DUF1697 family)
MQYVAFLRGVKVGGRNIMSMAALKQCFDRTGLDNVETFQSGNVIFESSDKSTGALTTRIERAL